jgi:hypothetical protein
MWSFERCTQYLRELPMEERPKNSSEYRALYKPPGLPAQPDKSFCNSAKLGVLPAFLGIPKHENDNRSGVTVHVDTVVSL